MLQAKAAEDQRRPAQMSRYVRSRCTVVLAVCSMAVACGLAIVAWRVYACTCDCGFDQCPSPGSSCSGCEEIACTCNYSHAAGEGDCRICSNATECGTDAGPCTQKGCGPDCIGACEGKRQLRVVRQRGLGPTLLEDVFYDVVPRFIVSRYRDVRMVQTRGRGGLQWWEELHVGALRRHMSGQWHLCMVPGRRELGLWGHRLGVQQQRVRRNRLCLYGPVRQRFADLPCWRIGCVRGWKPKML